MVVRLSDALSVPLRERNRMLEAAGLAPAYRAQPLATDDMAPFRSALERMLTNHEPYPGYVVDRHWNVVLSNSSGRAFLAGADVNVMELYQQDWRDAIVNWDVIAWSVVAQLRDEVARYPDDVQLAPMLGSALTAVAEVPRPAAIGEERVLCPHFLIGGQIIRTMTVVARFGSPRDVTLDELRLELVFPQDEVAESFFAALGRTA